MKKFLIALASICALSHAFDNNVSQKNNFVTLRKNIEKAQKHNENTHFQSLSNAMIVNGNKQRMISLMRQESKFKKIATQYSAEKEKFIQQQIKNLNKKQLSITYPTTEYIRNFKTNVLQPLDAELDQIIAHIPKDLIESKQDPSKEDTLLGSFLDMGYSEEQQLKDAVNDYTGLRIITQNRTLGITTFGNTNAKINTINKVIQLKVRNNDASYKNDVQAIVNLKNKTFDKIRKAATISGVYSPHIPEHRALLDCIETQENGKKIFVGITPTNKQFNNTFKEQHKILTSNLSNDKVLHSEYQALSKEFASEYNKYVDKNAPMQPLTEAIVYNLEEPTTNQQKFIGQYIQAFKNKTPMLIRCIEQKLEEVQDRNLDVRGFTAAHSYILAYVAQHQKSENDPSNQSYVSSMIAPLKSAWSYFTNKK